MGSQHATCGHAFGEQVDASGDETAVPGGHVLDTTHAPVDALQQALCVTHADTLSKNTVIGAVASWAYR